ncbi:MAG: glutathione S-transferase family protein [Polyangiaceae bacterium]|nr:glutathione S-transferase family protein [Polyangiaceae bacterium]
MKLYHNSLSPNARRPALVAQHLGIAIETVAVDFRELRGPEFLKINPAGRIPVLVDGDFVLTESRAIMQYLASQKPGLLPTSERARADVARWQFWDAEHFSAPLSTLAFEKLLKPMMGMGEPSEAAITESLARYERSAKVVDAHLGKSEWLVDRSMTIADLSVAASLTYAGPSGAPLDPYPHLKAWLGRIRELPAWQSTEPKPGG